MIKVTIPYGDYQDNLISEDFLLENNKNWAFSVGAGGGNIVELTTDEAFVGSHSIRIKNVNYNFSDVTIQPASNLDYNIVIPRTSFYNFCFRTLLKATAPWLPELVGGFQIYVNGGGSPTYTSLLKIGNNTDPEFSYVYNKWQLLYNKFAFQAGDTITIKIHINSDSLFVPNQFELFIDGFQFNYIDDRVHQIPGLYVKPNF
jgi:hypothetical protein